MKKKVQVIEVINPFLDKLTNEVIKKKRVCAYARVSTDETDQANSYENQIEEYTKRIESNDEWEFAGMYADKGISGTSTKNRTQFNLMIQAALEDKIDLILTKSISRFARNTVDILSTVRKLRDKNVEIFFEKENIYSSDNRMDFLLTIMSSVAQEESRSISENIRWSVKKRFKEGKVIINSSRFLGYDKDEDGNLVINPTQAKTVKTIFDLFLEGLTIDSIASILEKEGYLTGTGNAKWHYGSLRRILSNEKYCGDALLQKSITVDYLSHKSVTNNNIAPKYYVTNNHEAIIDKESFMTVQAILKNRQDIDSVLYQTNYPLTNLVFCPKCHRAMKRHFTNYGRKLVKISLDCRHGNKKMECDQPQINEGIVAQAVNDLVYGVIKRTFG